MSAWWRRLHAVLAGAAHRWIQRAVAPGADQEFERRLRPEWGLAPSQKLRSGKLHARITVFANAPTPSGESETRRTLDVGAGAASRFAAAGGRTVAVDISHTLAAAATRRGTLAVVASADALPFCDRSFDTAGCVGLLHHLPDEAAARAVSELARVTARGGRTVILDAVLPESPLRRPLARLIRRLDRGHWMREQTALEQLFTPHGRWATERFSYSWTGLEAVMAVRAQQTIAVSPNSHAHCA